MPIHAKFVSIDGKNEVLSGKVFGIFYGKLIFENLESDSKGMSITL